MVNFDFKTNASLPATGRDANTHFVERGIILQSLSLPFGLEPEPEPTLLWLPAF
ncbi:MAG: hypothetical protein H6Q17_319 [Bacteroidetes bacterium]|nr:hypothetical protein [Bacteroidota bacterium]